MVGRFFLIKHFKAFSLTLCLSCDIFALLFSRHENVQMRTGPKHLSLIVDRCRVDNDPIQLSYVLKPHAALCEQKNTTIVMVHLFTEAVSFAQSWSKRAWETRID